MTDLIQIFKPLSDSRSQRNRKHKFLEIIILSILAVLSGAETYDDIEQFGKEKIRFLRKFLELRHGIPSHDTINRIFQMLNPSAFEQCFANFTEYLKGSKILKEHIDKNQEIKDHIAIDGKSIRGSRDTFKNKGALHSVHAWSVANRLCLGQISCKEKSNEITTIPQLINVLDIRQCIISIDAMGTQTAIAEQIIENKGDYILAVKNNQPSLVKNVDTICNHDTPVSDTCTVEKNHGRVETRRAEVFTYDSSVYGKRWKSLQSVIKITATREFPDGKMTAEERYYISSLNPSSDFNHHIRSHWEIENKLHWVLDMTFNEDASRKREKNAAANFAIVNKMALNILRKDTGKGSLKGKRKRAGWNNNFLLDLLGNYSRLF